MKSTASAKMLHFSVQTFHVLQDFRFCSQFVKEYEIVISRKIGAEVVSNWSNDKTLVCSRHAVP